MEGGTAAVRALKALGFARYWRTQRTTSGNKG